MKIRDLCAAIGCGIDYDATTGQVILIPQENHHHRQHRACQCRSSRLRKAKKNARQY